MKRYRKRQMVKVYKQTYIKSRRLYFLKQKDKNYEKAFAIAYRVHQRAFANTIYCYTRVTNAKKLLKGARYNNE